MHHALLIIGDILGYLTVGGVILYAPLAGTWRRALLVPCVLSVAWGGVRVITILLFREPCPPLIGFAVLPLLYMLGAAALRAGKELLLRISFGGWIGRSRQKKAL